MQPKVSLCDTLMHYHSIKLVGIMAQIKALVTALKKQLRASGLTYKDVAQALELSEATVKRLFAEENFTLERLDVILRLMNLDFSDLLNLMTRDRYQLEQLTESQEAQIAGDVTLLIITVSVIYGFSFEELEDYYNFDHHKLIQQLATLDRLKIIDLLPGNRIKLRIAPNFRWLANGPIQQFFLQKVQQDFFNSKFDQDTEKLIVLNGLCSFSTNKEIQKKMQALVNEISELNKRDSTLPLGEKFGNTLVVALRQWQYTSFSNYVKQDFKTQTIKSSGTKKP